MEIKNTGLPQENLSTGNQNKAEDSRLRQACQEFESLFLNHLLSQMKKSIPKSDLFGQSKDHEMMEDILDTEYAKALSQANGIGLANVLYQQMRQNLGL